MKFERRFRQWDRELKNWVYLTLNSNGFMLEIPGIQYNASNWDNPQQFTDMYDAEGAGVWEGDIATLNMRNEFGSLEKKIAIMTLSNGAFRFDLKTSGGYILQEDGIPPTVIGNISTHPGLLQELSMVQ